MCPGDLRGVHEVLTVIKEREVEEERKKIGGAGETVGSPAREAGEKESTPQGHQGTMKRKVVTMPRDRDRHERTNLCIICRV